MHACACGLNIDDLVADVLVDVLLLHACSCTPNNECRVDVLVGIELHPYLDLDLSYMAYDLPVSSVKLPSMHKPYISKSRAGNYGHLLTIWSTWSKKLKRSP